jgi:GIY-YIG catalytic domain
LARPIKMNTRFKVRTNKLPNLLNDLKLKPLIPLTEVSASTQIPKKGVYVLYEGRRALYVGRSDNIKRRVNYHTKAGHITGANFAFKLAFEQATLKGILKVGVKLSKKNILENKDFLPFFIEAKTRVENMSLRVIRVNSPLMQHLFETYVQIALRTKYNDFRNH